MDSETAPGTTVVIATRDRREQLLHTLRQLTALPERPPIILVDNGSADGTPEAVRAAYPEVTVLEPGENLGAVGRTLGVLEARTDLVAFADDDSWWEPGALACAAELFRRHPRLGLLAARTLVGPEARLDPLSAELAGSPLGTEPDLPGPSVLGFLACASVVRRSAYLQAGGFSPVVFFFGEETVLAQDLAAAGWGLCYVPEVVAHHHPRPGRADRTRLQARNALLSTILRRPAGVALSSATRLLRSGDPRLRRAVWDAVRRLPQALRDRSPLPPEVEAAVRRLESA